MVYHNTCPCISCENKMNLSVMEKYTCIFDKGKQQHISYELLFEQVVMTGGEIVIDKENGKSNKSENPRIKISFNREDNFNSDHFQSAGKEDLCRWIIQQPLDVTVTFDKLMKKRAKEITGNGNLILIFKITTLL